ncbi:MAG: TIGR03643 family protein [Cytophagales bacterium]|nr:MAG: TIGR03643 family protein [Cytophagales bacterium]TAF61231.1 MAG: TIGR03643 family protein [Cytophagales bacterium]
MEQNDNLWCEYSGLPSVWAYDNSDTDEQNLDEKDLSEEDIDRIIQMAWEDRTSFEAIETQFGLNNGQVIKLMRKHMKASSFRMWRKRTTGRKTKHEDLRKTTTVFKSRMQRPIGNKISKR